MSPSLATPLRESLEALFAGDPAMLADPYALYREAREAGPVYDLGAMVLLFRYEDVRWALRETATLSNRALVEGSRIDDTRARLSGEAREAFDEVVAFGAHFASRKDGDDHARIRRIAHRAFTPRRVAELERAAQRYVDELLDEADTDGVIDLTTIAYRLPLLIVGDLLGVPHEDLPVIHGWSIALGAANAGTEAEPYLAARDAVRDFRAYLDGTLEENRRAGSRTDLVAVLMAAEEGERLTDEELAAMFVQLLFAGHETTTNLIATGLRDLLRSPDQWRAIIDDPGLVPQAVEELMRFSCPVQFASRLATEDITIGGVRIPADRTVIPLIGAAHRDPAAYDDPDRLDVRRAGPPNLGFGFGPHFCLGAALARLEAQVALRTIARRHPGVELAGEADAWSGGAMLRHLVALPVRLGPRQAA